MNNIKIEIALYDIHTKKDTPVSLKADYDLQYGPRLHNARLTASTSIVFHYLIYFVFITI